MKVLGEEGSCKGDAQAKLIKSSLMLTDVDNNDNAVISFLYDLGCEEDIAPSRMKFIMIEGKNKFKIRGAKKYFVDEGDHILNHKLSFNIDDSSKKVPKIFLDFATEQWNLYIFDT